MGTLRPRQKQSKLIFDKFEEALEQQRDWELIRVRGKAASRPKVTSLTYEQLKVAEASAAASEKSGVSIPDAIQAVADFGPERLKLALKALTLAEGESFTLVDAVKFAISHKLQTTKLADMDLEDGFARYERSKKGEISESHRKRVGQRCRNFLRFVGKTLIREVRSDQAKAWVESVAKPNGELKSKSTWNHLVTDLATVFSHFEKEKWCSVNPFGGLTRYSKKQIGAKARRRLEVSECEALFAYLEDHHPRWCCYYALTLILGIRPDLRTGEIFELARCVKRDGLSTYYSNGYFHLTAEITKEREPREVKVSANAAAWLKKYPPTPENICPGDYKDADYIEIRQKFKIPYDGLRHTAISAFMSDGNAYDVAADQFGNSEPIIKKHYLRRMSAAEAALFYAIMPHLNLLDEIC
jgi:hypothetical protein